MLFKRESKGGIQVDFESALDAVNTPIMMVNRDLEVTYVNRKTMELLTEHTTVFKSIWPNFNPANILGQSIDQFHKDPSHQRRILSDPSNFPYKTDISIGDLFFSLTVTAQTGPNGEYIGNTLEWDNVTEMRRYEKAHADHTAIIQAIDRSQATIEFDLNGKILAANDLFLGVMGYSRSEVIGQHHSIFVEDSYRKSSEYTEFWSKLNRGQFDTGEYKRFGKGGKEVWIRATYNPVADQHGKLIKVVKMANDVTKDKQIQQLTEQVLKDATSVMGSIASGDLNPRMDVSYPSEFNALSDSVNSCANKLTEIVGEIKTITDVLNGGISEISTGNTNLSMQTSTQASNLARTSKSMEEMTHTVKKNAENAQRAKTLAGETRKFATAGGKVVEKAVTAMDAINGSSKEISDIIGVIDDIAFQTNLLALNAAVEAARAGEQGRGFAVVASEVRSLAGRSAEAAKKIKTLIEDSVEKVGHGSSLVNDSGEKLQQIVNGVLNVSEFVDEIADASEKQAERIVGMNQSIEEIGNTTKENKTLVEGTAEVSELMSEKSQHLIQLISFFSSAKNDQTFTGSAATRRRDVQNLKVVGE